MKVQLIRKHVNASDFFSTTLTQNGIFCIKVHPFSYTTIHLIRKRVHPSDLYHNRIPLLSLSIYTVPATHSVLLHHTLYCCNIFSATATHYVLMQHSLYYCNILCSSTECVAVKQTTILDYCRLLQCIACSVLQCVAVYCRMLQCVAVCYSVLQCVAVCCSVLQCIAVSQTTLLDYCSVLQCVAVCCSMLQYVAVSCSKADDISKDAQQSPSCRHCNILSIAATHSPLLQQICLRNCNRFYVTATHSV